MSTQAATSQVAHGAEGWQRQWLRRPERFRKKVASEWVLNLLPGVSALCIPEREAVASPSTLLWGPEPGAILHATQKCVPAGSLKHRAG